MKERARTKLIKKGVTKVTYSIGEFAQLVNITTSTLRYYEQEGLLTPGRDKNNLRVFTDQDIGWVKFLLHLKGSGMTITELKKYTEWRSMGDQTIYERKNLLEKRKQMVADEMKALQENLDILNRKIEFYEDRLKGHRYEFVL